MIFHFPQRSSASLPKLDLFIEGTVIDWVSSFNFLGITIDEHLTWKSHVSKIYTKLNRSIGVLRRLQNFLPCSILKTLYNTLVLPHLQYGILLWGANPYNIPTLQKRAIRVVCKGKYISHTQPLFKAMEFLTIKDIFQQCSLKFYHKFKSGILPEHFKTWFATTNITHSHNTRIQNTRLPIPMHSSLDSFIRYSIPKLLTSTPSNITDKLETHSLHGFSRYIRIKYLNEYALECCITNCYVCAKQ